MPELQGFKGWTYRGSSADLAMDCPGSVNAPSSEIAINHSSEAAIQGTVSHRINQLIVETGDIPQNWQEICASYGLTDAQIKDLRFLNYSAKNFWYEFGAAFPNPMTEAVVNAEIQVGDETIRLTSHQDVLSVTENDGVVIASNLDWKTTRLDVSYTGQMLFYAWCVCLKFPGVSEVTTAVVYLRDRTHTIMKWSREQIEDFGQRFIDRVVKWDRRTYSPGSHCGYCQRFANCPAHAQMAAHTMDALITLPDHELIVTDPNTIIELYQKASAVNGLVEKFKSHVRAAVFQAGGELVGTNGQKLALVTASRDTIDARKAWVVLSEELTEDELSACLTVKKSAAFDAVAAHAPRGQKKAEKDRVMNALIEAGAVSKSEFTQLRVMQAKPQMKEIDI
jgi:hypothetical protein